jgi:hypothetical protein
MLKYEDFLAESLAAEIKSEPKTAAAKEARKMGLNYMGFGRYADSKGQIAYIVDNDRLVPYKSRDEVDNMYYKHNTKYAVAKKSLSPNDIMQKQTGDKEIALYNKTLNNREREDSNIIAQKQKEALAVNKELYKFYKPNMFSEDELYAIENYTGEAFGPVNRYLYKGHDPEVTPDQDQEIVSTIEALDSAFEETQAPFPYTVYSGLSERYSADKIKSGEEYIFRGYLSTSVSFDVSITSFTDGSMSNKSPVVLQIEISKGQKSIYVDPISDHQGELETMLPRGSRVKIISGPHMIDYSILNADADPMMIALFHCVLVEDE